MGPGWGCDSYRDTPWRSPSGNILMVPSCIPDSRGFGPYRKSPVRYVPTIMDRLHAAGRSWRIYRPPNDPKHRLPYGWAICPTFADCMYTKQKDNMVDSQQVISDASQGTLPNFSVVLPSDVNSQHNFFSMMQWNSTAIFITYDDCGCFDDEVPPPAGMGIRVPMVIVSPYAKASYTESTVASSYDSILAFTERVFGLQALTSRDANAYDYFGSFNFSQQPRPPVPLTHHATPRWERDWLRAHPPEPDET